MTIRRAVRADLDAMVRIFAASGAEGWGASECREEVERPGGCALVIEEGGVVAGGAVAWDVAGEVHVLQIAIDPGWRRRGLGRLLLAALIRECGGGPALLEVRADNRAAIALYSSEGFVEVGRRRRYYPGGEDAVLMTREIP